MPFTLDPRRGAPSPAILQRQPPQSVKFAFSGGGS
jgi:hypothetical protein